LVICLLAHRYFLALILFTLPLQTTTTLGHGDVTPLERWHLLGLMTAMNGVLLFGWSTAVIFEVLRRTLTTSRNEQEQREPEQCARHE
jgi:hypothetical protein